MVPVVTCSLLCEAKMNLNFHFPSLPFPLSCFCCLTDDTLVTIMSRVAGKLFVPPDGRSFPLLLHSWKKPLCGPPGPQVLHPLLPWLQQLSAGSAPVPQTLWAADTSREATAPLMEDLPAMLCTPGEDDGAVAFSKASQRHCSVV